MKQKPVPQPLDIPESKVYCTGRMVASQESGPQKSSSRGRVGMRGRLIAGAVFAVVALAFGVVNWGERTGNIRWDRLLSPCGFKQRTRLPCPTCGMTTAVRAFAAGRVWDSFYAQPAGGLLCLVVSAVGAIALVIALLGRDWGVLGWVRGWKWQYVVLVVAIIVISAWLVTLVRALSE